MSKKSRFKPGDMVRVLSGDDHEKYKKDDVGLVLPGTMYWPLTRAHSNGKRILMYAILIFGTKHWIDGKELRLIEKVNG